MNELAESNIPSGEILLSRQHVYATLTALSDDLNKVFAGDVPTLRIFTRALEQVALRFALQLQYQHERATFASELARYHETVAE